MRTAKHNVGPASPIFDSRKSSRSPLESSQNVLHRMPALGNQAMLRRLSSSAHVIRRDTPAAPAGKTAAPAPPAAGAGPAPAPDAAGKTDDVKVTIPWSDILNGKTTLLSFLSIPPQGDAGSPVPATAAAPAPPAAKGPTAAPATAPPTVPSPAQAGAGPAAPSRLSLKDFGTLSLGLRLGFPDLKSDDGQPPSALQQSIQTGEIINYSMTGKLPSAYQLDKGKLVGVCWSLFSTYVAPDMAAKIAKGLAGKTSGGGLSYELDGVLLPDFSGGGLSLTLKWGGSKAKARPAAPAGPVQPKLAVGSTTDPLEAEADQVADQVMRMPDPATTKLAGSAVIQRKCSACEEEENSVHRKGDAAASSSGAAAPAAVHQALKTPGQPLDAETRAFFEPRFGVPLNSVRIHEGPLAAQSAKSIGALAYTLSDDIVFDTGRFQPRSQQGRTLLAHELAHTIQQKSNRV